MTDAVGLGPDDARTALLSAARSGDAEALGALLEEFRPDLRGWAATRMGGGPQDASDLVQRTFVDAQQSFTRFQGAAPAQFRAWLFGILRHHLADTASAEARRQACRPTRSLDDSQLGAGPDELASPQSSPSQKVMRSESETRMLAALSQLPPDQREAVRLRHLQGWSLAQLAEHLERSERAVVALVHRGLTALRRALADQDASRVQPEAESENLS